MKSSAFIFDLNGTMINDMDYQINAWYKIVSNLGAGISMQNMIWKKRRSVRADFSRQIFKNRKRPDEPGKRTAVSAGV